MIDLKAKLMSRVHFYLRGTKEPKNVYLRLKKGREIDLQISTNCKIDSRFWSVSKKEIKEKIEFDGRDILEKRLSIIRTNIDKELSNKSTTFKPDKNWLRGILEKKGITIKKDSCDNFLTFHLENYIKSAPGLIRNGKIGISPATVQTYTTTLRRIKRYEEYSGARIELKDLDFQFHVDFINYASKHCNLSTNSIGKVIKQIKTVCAHARDEGFEINPKTLARKFSAPSEKSLFTTLNENDLIQLLKYQDKKYLENARDWLIIGCWTGCRVGDLMQLSNSNIEVYNTDKQALKYTQEKTNKLIVVPIHPHVGEIVKKHNGFPRPISAVKFNLYIKEVCKEVGLKELINGSRQNPKTHKKETGKFEKWQLIHSHTCRRSFATNHYNKLSNKLIMAVTGHSTETMLLQYIGETENNHVNQFLELWNQ